MPQIVATPEGESIHLKFGYDPYIIASVKAVPHATLKANGWFIPRAEFATFAEIVGAQRIDCPPDLAPLFADIEVFDPKPTYVLPDFRPMLPTWAENRGRGGLTSSDYQATGSSWIVQNEAGLQNDDMGLGKSKQFIDAVSYVYAHTPKAACLVLIVCKASNVDTWADEIAKFSIPYELRVVRGSPKERSRVIEADPFVLPLYFVMSYNIMRTHIDRLAQIEWDWVALDEAHVVKSTPMNGNQSLVAQAIHRLQSPRRYTLTGTPIVNGPEDAWNILRWLQIEAREWDEFERDTLVTIKYAPSGNPYVKLKKVVSYKPAGMSQLRKLIGPHSIRRLKVEELDNMPPLVYQTVRVTLNAEESTRYRAASDDLTLLLETTSDKETIAKSNQVMRLKQITSNIGTFNGAHYVSTKIAACKEIVEDASGSGQKVIIYTQFLDCLNALAIELRSYHPAIIHGGTTDRQKEVRRFQDDETCRVFLGSVAACREGLTLTAASVIVFCDKEWSPVYVQQAIDRAVRIGAEKHASITIITLEASLPGPKATVDAGIEKLLDKKADNARQVIAR